MATDKEKQPEQPIELDDKDIEQVAGGRKPAGAVEDPCAGGEVTRKR